MCRIVLDSRCRFILEYILKAEGYARIEDIARKMNVSKRSVYYDLSKINDWLSFYDIPEIQNERQKGIFISPAQKEKIKKEYNNELKDTSAFYIFSTEERAAIITCVILANIKPTYVERLVEICMVSRNTILNDLKYVKEELLGFNMALKYEAKAGYFVSGNVIRKRAVFLYYLSRITNLVRQKLLGFIDYEMLEEHIKRFSRIEEELNTEYVEGTLLQLSLLLMITKQRKESIEIDHSEEEIISKRKEYSLICKYFPELDKNEALYFSIHLLGSRVQVNQPYVAKYKGKHNIYELTGKLIEEFEQSACIEFNNREELKDKLSKHLEISLYRYRYGIVEGNPLAAEIENNYPELFHLTRKVADSLSKVIGYPITNSEVAYLTLHFGSHMRTAGNKKGMVRVLLVCPNGVSTANMLKRELEDLLPIIDIVDIISLKELDTYTGIFDLIVSTVEIERRKHAITVHPILSAIDKQNILSHIFKARGLNLRRDETDRVFNVVKDYVPECNHAFVYEALKDYFNHKYSVVQDSNQRNLPGLKDLITTDEIQLVDKMEDWQEAIRLAAKPLVHKNLVATNYVDAMVGSVKEFGPYIFITPEIALAHAKPSDGVIGLSVAFLLVKNGVDFFESHTSKLIIVLAPSDNESHLKVLKEIVTIFSEDKNLQYLLQAENSAEAYQRLKSFNIEYQ